MRLFRTVATSGALLLVTSCSGSTAPLGPTSLTATARAGAVELTNHSGTRVFYFLYERQDAARINWGPCIDPLRCPSLGPGDRVAIPDATIGGVTPGDTEVIVWWWRGGRQPALDEIYAIVVALQPA